MADLKQFAEQLVNLTVKEVNELATILKDEYGIEPAAAAVVAGPAVVVVMVLLLKSKQNLQ
jgi:large subunit ribosomal protein L7/L12